MKIGVLVSGTGSLLEAMIADGLEITVVLADRPCRGLEIAQQAGIPNTLLERTDFSSRFNREEYTQDMMDLLVGHDVELVVMAGFMTVFTQIIFNTFTVLNIHPSLLPSFKGDHAVRDALQFGVKLAGCTIHIATRKLDDGAILAQETVPVFPDDDEATLHERIKTVERQLYPATIRRIQNSEIDLEKEHQQWLSKQT